MNIQQRVFESNNLTSIMLKISETRSHQRNLTQINNRKSCLTTYRSMPHYKPKLDPNDFKFSNKLSLISSKKPHPKMNDGFLKIDYNHQLQAIKKKKEISEKIEKENWNFWIKMNNVKPFISSRSMDKAYTKKQKRMRLQKSRQARMTFPILGKSLSRTKVLNCNSYHHNHNQMYTFVDKQEI